MKLRLGDAIIAGSNKVHRYNYKIVEIENNSVMCMDIPSGVIYQFGHRWLLEDIISGQFILVRDNYLIRLL